MFCSRAKGCKPPISSFYPVLYLPSGLTMSTVYLQGFPLHPGGWVGRRRRKENRNQNRRKETVEKPKKNEGSYERRKNKIKAQSTCLKLYLLMFFCWVLFSVC